MRDRLWFFSTARHQGNYRQVGGIFPNLNAGDVNSWTANSVQSYNQTFVAGSGSWPRPTSILEARFIKLTTQFDF